MPTPGRRGELRDAGFDVHAGDLGVVAAIFATGLALSLLLASRAQVGGDQLNLLARGWLLVARGEWVPYGNPASTGGAVPGGLTALLIGAPLALVFHHRAPLLGVLLTQIVAFLVLDRWIARAFGRRERLLFAVLYWLNPWRLLLSGFLWNPGYMFLVGALHLWACWKQRTAASFVPSAVLALALGLGAQLHPAVILLGFVTMGLFVLKQLRLRWSGLAVGAVIAALPLVPWLAAVRSEPEKLPVAEGFIGRGLLLLFPVRGANYWLRYVSFYLPGKETRFDFAPVLGSAADGVLRPLGDLLVDGIGPVSFVIAVMANLWLWRRWRRRGWRRMVCPDGTARGWALAYLRISFIAALIVYALAPTTVMWWQPVPLLHCAALTVTLWASALLRLRPRAVTMGVRAWAATSLVLVLLLAFGGPRHRCGGRSNIVIPLRHDHPMLHDLGIHGSCRVPIQPDGWWPDVLPEPEG